MRWGLEHSSTFLRFAPPRPTLAGQRPRWICSARPFLAQGLALLPVGPGRSLIRQPTYAGFRLLAANGSVVKDMLKEDFMLKHLVLAASLTCATAAYAQPQQATGPPPPGAAISPLPAPAATADTRKLIGRKI